MIRARSSDANGRDSALFVGRIGHSRFAPRARSFAYPVYMAYIDLGELEDPASPGPFAGSRLFSASGRAAVEFRREDFHGAPSVPLSESVRQTVEAETGTRPEGPIRMLANLRTLGYQFNPIAVYYCFEPGGERLTHVVADVSNIPYGESHAYVFEALAGTNDVDGTAEKVMHVSPFLEMDYTYRLRTTAPTDELAVLVSNSRDGRVEFSAALRLNRRPASARELRRVVTRFPAMAISVTAKIFWQALKMRLAGYKWYGHQPQVEPAKALPAAQIRERATSVQSG